LIHVNAFAAPRQSFGDLSARTAAEIIEIATDIALVVDLDGLILDTAIQQSSLSKELKDPGEWRGRSWSDTVTVESRPKVTALLRDAAGRRKSSWRQLNHPSKRGVDLSVLYSAVRLGRADRIVALGRDLRPLGEMQQKLVQAQMSMERDYTRLRQVEARYRLLFQSSSDPALIVDIGSYKVIEANSAAVGLFGDDPKRVVGRSLPEVFDADSAERLKALISGLRSGGRGGEMSARLTNAATGVIVMASSFRQDDSSLILIRVPPSAGPSPQIPSPNTRLLMLAESAPDGMVVTDRDARILNANNAFIEMVQWTGERHIRGEELERWLGRPGVDLKVLVANLRQNQSVFMFSTIIRGEYGVTTDVEVSAVPLLDDATTCFGFAIRDVGRRLSPAARSSHELPRSADQLTDLIGRVPLKDLVQETTDAIERLCIEAALKLTGNNRAAAAELLGLSRQSLYVKLRQLGFADTSNE
jgi:transcriptional regulator PpsR